MCLADFAVSYIYETSDMNYEPDDEKRFRKSVGEIHKEKYLKKATTLKLKNSFGKTTKKLCQL